MARRRIQLPTGERYAEHDHGHREYHGGPFAIDPNTHDSDITVNSVACYCAGTRILTERGEVAVEALAIGDHVVTAWGEHRPIKWIGWRSYAGRFLAGRRALLPICFKAGSLGAGLPRRDLFVSPKHAMFADGVLIPAEQLVNGASVVRVAPAEVVAYYHVELDSHDLLVAEGAASESFVDDDSRGIFHNAADYDARYGLAREEAVYCAPRLQGRYDIERMRQRLS